MKQECTIGYVCSCILWITRLNAQLETNLKLRKNLEGYMRKNDLRDIRGCHTSSENGEWENGEWRMRKKRSE
jgi:hypothetical protein